MIDKFVDKRIEEKLFAYFDKNNSKNFSVVDFFENYKGWHLTTNGQLLFFYKFIRNYGERYDKDGIKYSTAVVRFARNADIVHEDFKNMLVDACSSDKEAILEILEKFGTISTEIDVSLKNDKDFVLEVFKRWESRDTLSRVIDGILSDNLKNEWGFMLNLIDEYGLPAINALGDKLSNNEEFMTKLVDKYGKDALVGLSEFNLSNNEEFMTKLIDKHGSLAFNGLGNRLRNNENFILELFGKYGSAVAPFVGKGLANDRGFIYSLSEKYGNDLPGKLINSDYLNNEKSMFYEMYEMDPFSVSNRHLISIDSRIYGFSAIDRIGQKLRNDEQFMRYLFNYFDSQLREEYDTLGNKLIGSKLSNNKDFMIELLDKFGDKMLDELGEDLKNDKEFMLKVNKMLGIKEENNEKTESLNQDKSTEKIVEQSNAKNNNELIKVEVIKNLDNILDSCPHISDLSLLKEFLENNKEYNSNAVRKYNMFNESITEYIGEQLNIDNKNISDVISNPDFNYKTEVANQINNDKNLLDNFILLNAVTRYVFIKGNNDNNMLGNHLGIIPGKDNPALLQLAIKITKVPLGDGKYVLNEETVGVPISLFETELDKRKEQFKLENNRSMSSDEEEFTKQCLMNEYIGKTVTISEMINNEHLNEKGVIDNVLSTGRVENYDEYKTEFKKRYGVEIKDNVNVKEYNNVSTWGLCDLKLVDNRVKYNNDIISLNEQRNDYIAKNENSLTTEQPSKINVEENKEISKTEQPKQTQEEITAKLQEMTKPKIINSEENKETSKTEIEQEKLPINSEYEKTIEENKKMIEACLSRNDSLEQQVMKLQAELEELKKQNALLQSKNLTEGGIKL